MANKKPVVPNRGLPVKGIGHKPGGPAPVGYGGAGHPFYNQQKYDRSPAGKLAGAGGPPKMPGNAGHTTPMPGHPSQNPTHYHGPSTIGKINGPAPRGGMK